MLFPFVSDEWGLVYVVDWFFWGVQGTVGYPFEGVEVRVVDEEGNVVVRKEDGVGVEGELWVRGGQVFKE